MLSTTVDAVKALFKADPSVTPDDRIRIVSVIRNNGAAAAAAQAWVVSLRTTAACPIPLKRSVRVRADVGGVAISTSSRQSESWQSGSGQD